MTEFPETRESLLAQVRSHDNREAWEQFASIYRPVIYRLARHRGLPLHDILRIGSQIAAGLAAAHVGSDRAVICILQTRLLIRLRFANRLAMFHGRLALFHGKG